MEEDKKLDELAKTFASQINQQDVNVISNLANNALKNNDEKMENVSNAFNEVESKKDEDELTPEEDDKEVSVRKADQVRDIKAFLSYFIGCVFGRYSLDEKGLIFADQFLKNQY